MSTHHNRTRIVEVPLTGSSDLIRKAWDQYYGHWSDYANTDSFHQGVYRMVDKTVRSLLPSAGKSSLIDLGCGTGEYLRLLQNPAIWTHLTGVDMCRHAITRARNADFTGFPRIKYHECDLAAPAAVTAMKAVGVHDIALAVFLLDEVFSLENFFHAARAAVAPGGHLICAMLDETRERERHELSTQPGYSASRPIVLETVKKDDFGGELVYYRIVRPREEPVARANAAAWLQIVDQRYNSEELQARDGPALRMLVFQRDLAS